MKRKHSLFYLALSVFIIASCSKSNGDGSNNNSSGGTTNPGTLFIAVRSVLQTNCAVSGCHLSPNPQNGIDFSNDNTIVAQRDRIKVRAVDQAGTSEQMPQPPRAPLSQADRQKIVDWVNAGGKISN